MALNLRATYKLPLSGRMGLDLIAEVFNVTNRTNYDVNSILNGEFLSGPTFANPALVANPNPRFGEYTSALPSREAQFGLRFRF